MPKYYVRTIGTRKFDYSPLEYEILIDKERTSGKHFLECLKYIQNEDAVLLEDDLELCDNFQKEIEKVISEHPNNIINFFTQPQKYFTSHLDDLFQFNQCTYYPKGILKKVIPLLEPKLGSGKFKFYGACLHSALNEAKIPVYMYRPALVQHKDVKSILTTGRTAKYQTIYYKDYLDKLGIDIEEAYSLENQQKLEALLEQDNERWAKEYGGNEDEQS